MVPSRDTVSSGKLAECEPAVMPATLAVEKRPPDAASQTVTWTTSPMPILAEGAASRRPNGPSNVGRGRLAAISTAAGDSSVTRKRCETALVTSASAITSAVPGPWAGNDEHPASPSDASPAATIHTAVRIQSSCR